MKKYSNVAARATAVPLRRRMRLAMLSIAAGLVVVLTVDPFGLGNIAATVANASTTPESRADNLDDALAKLPQEVPEDATELTGSLEDVTDGQVSPAPANLPAAASATVTLIDGQAVGADLGGMPVELEAADSGTSPHIVSMRTSSKAAAQMVGIDGVLLELVDSSEDDGESNEGKTVKLTVSYANFAGLTGGDWSSRLRLVSLPDCIEDGQVTGQCRPKALPSVNDPVAQTITATVPVDVESNSLARSAVARPILPGAPYAFGSLALTAGASGPGGDWSQTNLPQSASWGTSGGTGAYGWSYPMPVTRSPGGLTPELSLSYSSAVSDGRVPSQNNQASWVGEGFELPLSYVERQYKPCLLDKAPNSNSTGRDTGDLCWGTENATLVLNGAGTPLIRDSASGVWRGKTEDGSQAELLSGGWNGTTNGEYWKVTTVDGTQYFFGRGKTQASGADLKSAWTVPVFGNNTGEPCYHDGSSGGFAASKCTQVWRWNLDHVVDRAGNTMTYTYEKESNEYIADYAHNDDWTMTSYVSGGHLKQIDYGARTGALGNAPYRVVFGSENRCVTQKTDGTSLCVNGDDADNDKSRWLDTPADLRCSVVDTDNCMNVVPTFFETSRLSKITAQSWDGASYRDTDVWAFKQRFVGEGSDGSIDHAASVTLRLDSVQRSAKGATSDTADDITLPAIQFGYMSLPNRVDDVNDGQSALWRPRVTRIRTESGGTVNISYRTECTAASVPGTTDAAQAANTKLCYLVKWQPSGEATPQNHWFHKYVVESVVEDGAPHVGSGGDLITGSVSRVTRYEYLGDPAWRKPVAPLAEPADLTYSEFRGYEQVAISAGEGTEKSVGHRTTYFRGLGGTLTAGPAGHTISVSDREEYAGQPFATQEMNGAAVLSETMNKPAVPITVATAPGGLKSTRIPSTSTYGFTYDASGGLVHRTASTTNQDEHGLPTLVEELGDLAVTGDELCTRTTYRRDGAYAQVHMLDYVAKTEVFGAACNGTLANTTLVSRDTTTYDSAGRVLETRAIDPDDIAKDTLLSTTVYDAAGRVISQKDALGNVVTTGYTTGSGGQVSEVATTSPDPDGSGPATPLVSTQKFNPLTGALMSSTDANGLITKHGVDALGRATSVRLPEHATTAHPSVEYAYSVAPNGLNAVVTRALGADGQRQHTSTVLYDGLGRPFQSQTEGADGAASDPGRMVSHAYYDSAGRMTKQTSPWWAKGKPSAKAIAPIAVPPAQTTFVYDKAGRVTESVLWNGTESNPDHEQWRTKTVYDGAATLVIPPQGGTPVETVSDALGRRVQLREYVRDPATHATADTAAEVRALTKQTTSYAYDIAGQLTSMTDPLGNRWSYTYDHAGRQIAAADPDSGTTSTTYDLLGRERTRTDANGATVASTYDALGRQTSLREGSVDGTVRASWTYDASTRTDGGTARGQVSSSTRFVGGKEYKTAFTKYDVAYRPTQIDTTLPTDAALRTLSGKTFTTKFGFASDGQPEQVTYPQIMDGSSRVLGAETVTTRFDAASKPTWMSGGFGWGTYVAAARWTADGKPLLQDLGNTYGAVVSYDWDNVTQRLQRIRLDRERVDGTELDVSYGYDAAGNVTSMADAPTNTSLTAQRDVQCFDYGGLQRLRVAWTSTAANCGETPKSQADVGGLARYWTEYSYDALGNRTAKTEHGDAGTNRIEYKHGEGTAGPHQLTSETKIAGDISITTGFTWDAAGNQTSRTVGSKLQTQTWDIEGELTSVTGGDDSVSNIYDANGARLIRTDSKGTTVFLPGGQEVLVGDTSVSATRWYAFAGSIVATRSANGLSGVTSIATDHHGTPMAYVHNTEWSAGVQRVRTDPFGAPRQGQSGSIAGRGYLGAPEDTSGFTMLGARFYDPGTGTFLSVDPLLDAGLPAQFNAYVYSGNNPVTWSDPTGENWWSDFWGGVGKWWNDNKSAIEGFAFGVVVGIGCTVATGGVGALGCAMVGGAVGSGYTNVAQQVRSGKGFDGWSLANDMIHGAFFGAVGFGAAKGVSALLGKANVPGAGKALTAARSAQKPASSSKYYSSIQRPGVAGQGGWPRSSARPSASPKSPRSSNCASNSFVPGTSVLLADGSSEPIESLKLGDEVAATDPETGKTSAEPVIATITGKGEKDLTSVTLRQADGAMVKVTATDGHPIWADDLSKWLSAGELKPGMRVRTVDGGSLEVVAVEHEHRSQIVHNLTINGTHTYYVVSGAAQMLTHNCPPGSTNPTGSGSRASGDHGADYLRGMPNAERQELANNIADHGFDKHVTQRREFTQILGTEQELAGHVDEVIRRGMVREDLRHNRTAFLYDGTIVIHDPGRWTGGTVFRPDGDPLMTFLKLE